MRIHNLYEDSEGVSHFRDIGVEWEELRQSNKFSARQAASAIVFRETTKDYTVDWHPAPRRQYVINLDSAVHITAGDGETRYIGPGEVVLVEDTTGKGHISKFVGGAMRRSIFVALDYGRGAMYLNKFADGLMPEDMTGTDEFRSLLASAADLGIPHAPAISYRSCNIVLRRQRFHFLEWGKRDAPPIVLLHGGHQSAHSWDLVSLHLAQHYRVLALDQRGHGDSEWARDVEYTNHAMALDALAFLDAMQLEKPILIGHSMGGRNSLLLTRQDPARLRALVIVDVGPEVSDRGRAAIAGFVQENQEFEDLEHFVANVRKYDPYRPREHIERTVKYNMLQRADGKFVSKCDSNPRRLGIVRGQGPLENITLEDAAAFHLPVLLVRGERSNILAPDAAERFRDALPLGRLVTVPNCGHNVHGQNTLGFIEALGEFLQTLR